MSKNYRKQPSLIRQMDNRLTRMQHFGTSKYEDKIKGNTDQKIYSWGTKKTYTAVSARALRFIQAKYPHVKNLHDAKAYVPEYLEAKKAEGMSASTLKTYNSALLKTFGEKDWGVELPKRKSAEFVRSRGPKVRDRHFSLINNAELISFCRCTGLRRAELEGIVGTDLVSRNGNFYISVTRNLAKGGRDRESLIVGSDEDVARVVARCRAAGTHLVWGKAHSNADIHSYRSDYAKRLYAMYARAIETLPRSERYDGRGINSGKHYDKQALQIISLNLGHSKDTADRKRQRLGVVVTSYLYE